MTDSTTRPPRPDEARRAALLRHDRESTTRPPRTVDGDRIRWLFENYGFGAGRDCDTPDDDQLADFIEDLRDDFRAEAAAPDAGLREALERIESFVEHWHAEADAMMDGMYTNLRTNTGMHAARASALNEVYDALRPILMESRAALAAHRSSDPSPAPDRVVKCVMDRIGALTAHPAPVPDHGPDDGCGDLLWAHMEAEPGFSEALRQGEADIAAGKGTPFRAAPAGPAVDPDPPAPRTGLDLHIDRMRAGSVQPINRAAGPAVDQAIDWPKRWSDDDIAWVKRQIIAEYRRAAGPAVGVDRPPLSVDGTYNMTVLMHHQPTEFEKDHGRWMRDPEFRAAYLKFREELARLTSSDPTGEPE